MNAEDAFLPTQDRKHFFASTVTETLLAHLQQGLDHPLPVLLVTGSAGVGKSSLVREACARWGVRVRAEWLTMPGAAPELLMPQTVRLFGGQARGADNRAGWLTALSRTLGIVAEQDQTPLLIVEDAHTLSGPALGELAAIHTAATEARRTLRIVLVGQPDLETRLEELAADPLLQLVAVRCRVTPLPALDVRHYLHHRVAAAGGDSERVFSRKAARELHAASGGVPGRIDVLAAEAIRCAQAAGIQAVGQEHVRAAVTAVRRFSPPPASEAAKLAGAAAVPSAPAAAPSAGPALPVPATRAPSAPSVASTPPRAASAPTTPSGPPSAPTSKSVARPAGTAAAGTRRQSAAIAKPALPPAPKPPATPAAATPSPTPDVTAQSPVPPASPPPAPPAATPAPRAPGSKSGAIPKPARLASRKPGPLAPPRHDPMPFPEQPPLDSGHPRVKEWVSRFTEGDDSLRFGARMQLPPLTEPDALPVLYAPELAAESVAPPQLVPPAAPAQKPARAADPVATTPIPRAPDPAPIVIVPEPIVLPPEPKVLRPDAVTPLRESAAKPMLASARDNRRKRRQRERERAAAAAPPPASARPAAAAPAPPRAPAPAPAPAPTPVLAASPAPRDLIDESLTPRRPAFEPPPGRRNAPPRPPGQGRFLHVVVPGLLMLGVAAAAIIAGTRGGFEKDSPQPPVEVTSSPPLEPAPEPVLADSNLYDSSATDTTTPIARVPLALTPTPTDSPPPRFCLAVGTYLFVDRARIISRQLSRRTGLDSWVEAVASDGARNYRIMIGGFATQAEAEKVADRMLGRGLVTEAMVQPLPPDHVRQ